MQAQQAECAALTGDTVFLERLAAGSFRGQVHSVFEQVVNLRGDDGDLYCLTTAALDPGPLSLRLDTFSPLGGWGLCAGDPVFLQEEELRTGNRRILWKKAQPWQSVLPPFARRRAAADTLADLLRQRGKPGGMLGLLVPAAAGDLLARTLRERSLLLLEKLESADWTAAEAAALRLIGLGGGLTPSGDDFLSGLLLTLNQPEGPYPEECRRFGRELAERAAERTHDISAAMLRQAAAGRTRQRVLDFLTAMDAPSPDSIAAALPPLLAIGALSGTDLAVGLWAGTALGQRRLP